MIECSVRLADVGHALGRFLVLVSLTMCLPLVFAVFEGPDSVRSILASLLITLSGGGLLAWLCPKPKRELAVREALLTVVAVWVAGCLVGSLPFCWSVYFADFTDAFFEATSGFTTTGATILKDVEILPPSLQFWRHFTHWLGGMGIIMLGIAILPVVGVGGKTLYNAQFAGTPSEALKPRVLETARTLWKVYAAMTAAEFAALYGAGMSPFDAICHTFSTLGTGGFSTRTSSIAHYHDLTIEIIVIFFMILSSLNFATQYRTLWVERRLFSFLRDPEVRFHLMVLGIATIGAAVTLVWYSKVALGLAFRQAVFQVTSIGTTTGFATADYELWHPFAQLTLLMLMYLGGNTSSTAGGFKSFRMLLLLRLVVRAMTLMVHRRQVVTIRIGTAVVSNSALASLLNLVLLGLMFNFGASLLLAASGLDLLTSFSAVPACMFSVGPALGSVGPAENYAHLSAFAKWVLSVAMLVGRVEFYTALVLLTPAFWRK
ncbi:MAG: TrkH family potassium uptake protein [Acidobacteriota bacterium]